MQSKPFTVEFTIRSYRPADFERLWEIDQTCFPSGIAYTQMELMGFIAQRNAITLVAESGDSSEASAAKRISGFAVARPSRGIGHILTLDVVHGTRRSGLGSRLLQECEDYLRRAGCREVQLEAAVNNEAALRLYHKHGYVIIRTLPDYYSSHSLDAVRLSKRLAM